MTNISNLCSHLVRLPISWALDALKVRQLCLQCDVMSFMTAHFWLGILAVAGIPA